MVRPLVSPQSACCFEFAGSLLKTEGSSKSPLPTGLTAGQRMETQDASRTCVLKQARLCKISIEIRHLHTGRGNSEAIL